MIPRLEFIHLLWSYLPGFPLAVCVYLGASSAVDSTILFGPANKIILTLYFLIVPLIIGLFLDGIRHTLPNLILPQWKSLPKDQLKKDPLGNTTCGYSDLYIESLCAQTALTYCMYEFFGNIVLALVFCWPLFPFLGGIVSLKLAIIGSLVLIVLSYICMRAFLIMNNKNIESWFSQGDKDT